MKIAIVGATGLVGREVLKIIEEKGINKKNKIYLYATNKSAGKRIRVGIKRLVVHELCLSNLQKNYNFAIFTAGGEVSKIWANEFVCRGAVVIDNSSAFRRDENVPLVVPEINFKEMKDAKVIANPNCSTIGASLPLHEVNKVCKINRVIVSTYQAVSGAGKKGINDLKNKTEIKFNCQINNNLIPQIDKILPNGYTFEEDKMEFELKKILNNFNLKVSATCVRVPVMNCHSASVYVEFEKIPNMCEIEKALKKCKSIKLLKEKLPMPIVVNGLNEIYVGRLRKDSSNNKAISFFISFDNLRKGAALNAVQILEKLLKRMEQKTDF